MRKLAIAEIEAVIGKPMSAVLMKQIALLDEGSCRVLARSPLAGFGYRDDRGIPHTTIIGGRAGFVSVLSEKRIAIEIGRDVAAKLGSGVSFVFMLPGLGDTFRLNGAVEACSGGRLEVSIAEGFIHCPKCILRSRLWEPVVGEEASDFLASSSFAIISTWNDADSSDTSPRGDPAGFIKMIDRGTIAIPDRKGNRRIDTFRNLTTCDQISLAALIPGRHELLHMHGTAWVTDDPTLLSTMALKDAPPQLALCVRVIEAKVVANEALRAAQPWQAAPPAQQADLPNLIELGAQHLASNKDKGIQPFVFRLLARLLGAFPAASRRLLDSALSSDLEKEGYGDRKPK